MLMEWKESIEKLKWDVMQCNNTHPLYFTFIFIFMRFYLTIFGMAYKYYIQRVFNTKFAYDDI